MTFTESLIKKALEDAVKGQEVKLSAKVKRAPQIEERETSLGVVDRLANAKAASDFHKALDDYKKDYKTNKIQHGGSPYGDKGPQGPDKATQQYMKALEEFGLDPNQYDIEVLKAAAQVWSKHKNGDEE